MPVLLQLQPVVVATAVVPAQRLFAAVAAQLRQAQPSAAANVRHAANNCLAGCSVPTPPSYCQANSLAGKSQIARFAAEAVAAGHWQRCRPIKYD